MKRNSTVGRKEGQVVRIDLGSGKVSYARVLIDPLVAFYDKEFAESDEVEFDKIVSLPIAFKIWIMNYTFKERRWPVIGILTLEDNLKEVPKFWKQDLDTKKITIYQSIPELAPDYERPASLGEVQNLECAAVWNPEHVEDRLRDHFAKRKNKWVESMRVIHSDAKAR